LTGEVGGKIILQVGIVIPQIMPFYEIIGS
jgi:hypothetical protein